MIWDSDYEFSGGFTIENAIGGNSAETLIGNACSNTLTGDDDADQFLFSATLQLLTVDTPTDSTFYSDMIQLDDAISTALAGRGAGAIRLRRCGRLPYLRHQHRLSVLLRR